MFMAININKYLEASIMVWPFNETIAGSILDLKTFYTWPSQKILSVLNNMHQIPFYWVRPKIQSETRWQLTDSSV